MPLAQAAMSSSLGEFGIHFITFSIVLFAYSSLIGNYYYAESNIKFIKDNRMLLFVFRLTCLLAIFLGTLSSFDLAWSFADIAMGLMAFVNLIAIFILGKWALKALADYQEQKKQGLDPVFVADSIEGMPATECWHESADQLHEGDRNIKHGSLIDEMFTTD
jgi:AGCS family alanine or glycine:cation symporter